MDRSLLLAIVLLSGAALARAGPMHDAAGSGDVQEVRRLLAQGADINAIDQLKGTPLHAAAVKGQLGVVEVLVAGGADVHGPVGMLRFTPLHMAALGGSGDVAALLIDSGAEIDARNSSGNMPLHLAADAGQFAVAEVLVAAGAGLDAQNTTDVTPIHYAGAASSGTYDRLSAALARLEGAWGYEELNAFLANPKGFAPGTTMAEFQGVADPQDRADLIVYLRQSGDDPPPLPE